MGTTVCTTTICKATVYETTVCTTSVWALSRILVWISTKLYKRAHVSTQLCWVFKNFYKCLHCSALESGVTLKLRTIVWYLRWCLNKTTESEKERCRHYVEIFYTSDLRRCTYVRTKLPLTTAYVEYVGGTETLEGYLKRRTKGKSLGRCMLSLRSSNSFSCGLSSTIWSAICCETCNTRTQYTYLDEVFDYDMSVGFSTSLGGVGNLLIPPKISVHT